MSDLFRIVPHVTDNTTVGTNAAPDAGDERHISGSVTAVIIRYVERMLGAAAVDDLLRRAGEERPLEAVAAVAGWSSYAQACALFAAAHEVTGDPEIGLRVGEELIRQHRGTEVAALLRSLGSPGEVLRNVAATAAKYSTVTRMEAVGVGDTWATISAVTTSGFRRHRLFCDYTAGVLSQASVLFGMDAAVVEEVECQTRGASRCLYEVRWDPTTSADHDPVRRAEYLEAQLSALTERFESLQATAAELVTVDDIETLLARIAHRAGLAVRAPRQVLAVRLPGESDVRVHDQGVGASERHALVAEILADRPDEAGGARLIVDVASTRRHYGRLAAIYPEGSRFFAQERRILSAYAAQAAAALDTATALRDIQHRNETARDLLRLSSELANVASSDEVAARIASAVPTVVDVDQAAVFLWDPESQTLTMRASLGLDADATGAFSAVAISPSDTPLLASTLENPQPLFLDTALDDPFVRGLLDVAGAEAAAVVPISAHGEFFGVIAAAVRSDPERLRSTDHLMERLEGLAAQAAAALHNSYLLEEVNHRALHDPLTGLPNRALLRDRLGHALADARRDRGLVGVLFLDLDGLKDVNDLHGHAVGDAVIAAAAARFRAVLRPGDTVARVSGDEFVVILPGIRDRDATGVVARKLLAELGRPMVVEGRQLHITASVGAAVATADDSYDEVMRRADAAMYGAKRGGRSTVVLAPASSTVRSTVP